MVGDDEAARGLVSAIVERQGYRAIGVSEGREALARVESDHPSAIILDVGMPSVEGLATLGAMKQLDRDIPVIVVSGGADTTTVVQAMRLGAADFVCKPLNDEVLKKPLAHALRQRALAAELAALRTQIQLQPSHRFLLGTNGRVAEVRRLIDRVADTDVTVLIRGESGTGKELVARAIHTSSSRRDHPLVKVNCAALPTELLESELFGYERGAFTGAIQQKPGKFEFANHGTMFLDEIGEVPPTLQAKLLQVLQDGEFSRLGGKSDLRVDARIVAATNRDLEQAVALGQFREDLLFRLNVVTIALPPLRERREDIAAFTEYFLKKFSVHYNKPRPSLSADTRELMEKYEWPGNVRELENMVRRLIILGSEAPIQRELARGVPRPVPPIPAMPALPSTTPASPDQPDAEPAHGVGLKEIARTAARDAERVAIEAMLRRTRWNRKEAAEILGISYKALLYKIKETGLDKNPFTP